MKQLFIAGSGIKALSHLTLETKKILVNSEKVLYLLNDIHMKEWVERECLNSESLDEVYFSATKRIDSYKEISSYIISTYNKHDKTCVLMYGHPTVFASSALWAAKKIRSNGGSVVILPAVSSLDCLFADLSIDPGDYGCFSVDATDFLIYKRVFDNRAHLILWQVGSLACFGQEKTTKIEVLYNYLSLFYPGCHEVIIYEAATYPSQAPKKEKVRLDEICSDLFSNVSTLYIPPVKKSFADLEMVKLLDIDVDNFR